MFIPLEILKNQLIRLPPVKEISLRHHQTGLPDAEIINEVRRKSLRDIGHYIKRGRQPVDSFTIAEFGPGQRIELLAFAAELYRPTCAIACDVECYLSSVDLERAGLSFVKGTQQENNLPTQSLDLAISFDVLEHVRYPVRFLEEAMRALKVGGLFFASWDLRDHFNLENESCWFDMHQYSEACWRSMTFNRSNFVNRLSKQQWFDIVKNTGFEIEDHSCEESSLASGSFLRRFGKVVEPTTRINALLRRVR